MLERDKIPFQIEHIWWNEWIIWSGVCKIRRMESIVRTQLTVHGDNVFLYNHTIQKISATGYLYIVSIGFSVCLCMYGRVCVRVLCLYIYKYIKSLFTFHSWHFFSQCFQNKKKVVYVVNIIRKLAIWEHFILPSILKHVCRDRRTMVLLSLSFRIIKQE